MAKAKAAQGSLDSMASAAGVTAGTVSKVGNAFSGERLIREASAAALAVQEIGGASKLTESEMARVNRTTGEALAKMKALGLEAPAEIVKLNEATKSTKGLFELLPGPIGKVGASLMTALGPIAIAGSVVAAGKKLLDLTGNLTDLSAKTGISTTALQKLGYVTEQAGVSLEDVSGAVNKMSKALVTGDKGAVAGLDALRLSTTDLLAMSPDAAFTTIGDAIAKIENPMERATIATKIFGKSGADMLPAFTGDLGKLADEAERSGAILSEDTVRGGDAAGDAIGRLANAGMGLIGQVLGPLAPVIELVADLLGRVLGTAAQIVGKAFEFLRGSILTWKSTVYDSIAAVGEMAQKVPFLADKLGITTDAIQSFRKGAAEARQAIVDMSRQGIEPTTAAVAKAAPIIGDYATQTEKASRAKKAATSDADKFAQSVKSLAGNFVELRASVEDSGEAIRNAAQGFNTDGTLITNTINETAKATAEARKATEEWARANGAVLAPSIVAVAATVEDAGTQAVSRFATLMQGLPQSIIAAIQGGGSVIGAAGATIGTNLMNAFTAKFGPAITAALPFGIGSAITALLPTLGPMFGPVAEKIAGFFKNIFGGPSQEELRGRQAVADFEKQLAGLLNQTQKNEAGNESWKMTVIAIRDAYLAVGRTEAEALADAERLWKSSKGAAGESARVIAEIDAKMKQQGETAKAAIDGVKDALDGLPDRIDIPVNVTSPEGDPTRAGEGFARGTKATTGSWYRNFGGGTRTTLHGDEAVVPRGQAAAFAEATGVGGMSDAVAAEVAGLRSDFAMLPQMIGRAVRDAVLVAG
jgi:hypothetical protein